MKENYFSEKTYKDNSIRILQTIKRLIPEKKFKFDPERSALLILDMQNYFLDESSHAFIPSTASIIPGIKELVSEYSRKKLPIIFTRHLNTPEDAGMMKTWWKDLITRKNNLSEVFYDLDTSNAIILEKQQYDAFYNTGLKEILIEKKVENLVICGVMTNLCCETTARSGFINGYKIFFLVDGTATYNYEFHLASILNLAFGFAVPVLFDDIKQAFCER